MAGISGRPSPFRSSPLVIGAINGVLVNRTKLPSFIVTLATLFIIRGLTVGLTRLPNTLRPLGLNQTTPATAPATLSEVMFSEDDKKLLVSYKGSATTPGYIYAWDVASDGSLSAQSTRIALPGGGKVAFGMTPVRGQNAIFVTDPGNGFEVVSLSGSGSGGKTTPAGEMASCWASYSAATKNYYATDAGASVVREISVDSGLNAKVVGVHNLTANATPIDTQSAVIRNKGCACYAC